MPSIDAAVVVNPASANGATGKRWPAIAEALKQGGFNIAHSFTEGPDHATELTENYLAAGHELVIAVGGDGTVNEVVNGFFQDNKVVHPSATFALISTGTGGDLARTLKLPRDLPEKVRLIAAGAPRPVDVGRVSFVSNRGDRQVRYFINIAGLGLDGDTVSRVNRTSKALGGFVSFLWGTLASLALYRNKKMKIVVDDKQICDEPITLIVIGNGCYFGGGMFALPHAIMDDGLFDIMVLHNLSKLELLANLPKVYSGKHLGHPRITSLRGKKVSVISEDEALLNLDGEQPGRSPAEIELLPLALNIRS